MIDVFLSGFADFFARNTAAIIFYGIIILAIYWFRHKLHWEGKFIGLYKTKIGVKLMQSIADKFPRTVRGLGYAGIPVGFFGMTAILALLIHGLWKILSVPDAPQVVGLVLPGVHIPGLSVAIPLIIGWLALFVVIVVHEFSHGVVSKAHKIPVKSSGLLFFGPLLGAFVEPEEKKLLKAKKSVQLSIFAAGPWSNVLAMFFFGLVALAFIAATSGSIINTGVELTAVTEGLPAATEGLTEGTVIVGAQGLLVENTQDFMTALGDVKEGETITLVSQEGQEYTLVAAADDNPETNRGVIGVNLRDTYAAASDSKAFSFWLTIRQWIIEFFEWVIILNLGIGLANLLPLGPVDGGRMMHLAQVHFFGKKRGERYWKYITMITIALLVAVLLLPLFL